MRVTKYLTDQEVAQAIGDFVARRDGLPDRWDMKVNLRPCLIVQTGRRVNASVSYEEPPK